MLPIQLGKLPAKQDSRNLKLTKYLPDLPAIPDSLIRHDFKPISDWGMDGNDQYGNCVIVTAAHIIDLAKAIESDNYERISDGDVIALSANMGALDGFYILDRLKTWRKQGMWSSFISAFVDIEPIDHDYLKAAIYIFGHADIGLMMPEAWQDSNFWDVGGGSRYTRGSWGGHSVPLLGYYKHPHYGLVYYACTWGRIIEITAHAISKYCDEVYTSILFDWYSKDDMTPSGFKVDELAEDLRKLD